MASRALKPLTDEEFFSDTPRPLTDEEFFSQPETKKPAVSALKPLTDEEFFSGPKPADEIISPIKEEVPPPGIPAKIASLTNKVPGASVLDHLQELYGPKAPLFAPVTRGIEESKKSLHFSTFQNTLVMCS